jgi:SpoVK/Ycf46/Vps4 family AAA+-type ATPase
MDRMIGILSCEIGLKRGILSSIILLFIGLSSGKKTVLAKAVANYKDVRVLTKLENVIWEAREC